MQETKKVVVYKNIKLDKDSQANISLEKLKIRGKEEIEIKINCNTCEKQLLGFMRKHAGNQTLIVSTDIYEDIIAIYSNDNQEAKCLKCFNSTERNLH